MKALSSFIFVLVAYKSTRAEKDACQVFRDNNNGYITTLCTNLSLNPNEQIGFKRYDNYCIIIQNSSIPTINTGVLKDQRSLRDLRISYSKLCVIEKGAVPFSDQLEILQLDGNCITEIAGGILNNLSRLRHLDLSQNDISVIYSNTFDGLTALERLIFVSNKLSGIEDTTLSSLSALRSLDISRNRISTISKDAFAKLSYLEQVMANNNLLENIDFLLKIANTIQYLDVSFNKLPKITSVFKRLEKLEYLDLSHNEISDLETNSFVGLSGLKFLKLNNNKLKELCQSCFLYLTTLKHLYLSNNFLSEVNFVSFVDLVKLDTLTLDFNRISKTYSNFLVRNHFPNVKTIILTNNAWKCKDLANVLNILVKKNISFVSNYVLNNETNIYGVPCSKDCPMPDPFINSTNERIVKEYNANYEPLVLIIVTVNCILIITLVIFKVMQCFCKRKKNNAPQRNFSNQPVNRDFEVINDLYNFR